jgi:hypothetical protein
MLVATGEEGAVAVAGRRLRFIQPGFMIIHECGTMFGEAYILRVLTFTLICTIFLLGYFMVHHLLSVVIPLW